MFPVEGHKGGLYHWQHPQDPLGHGAESILFQVRQKTVGGLLAEDSCAGITITSCYSENGLEGAAVEVRPVGTRGW